MGEELLNLLEYYGSGLSIPTIAKKMNRPEEDILHMLKEYKESQIHKRQYSDELKKLVAQRDIRGVARKEIMEELGVSRSLLMGAIEEFGFLSHVEEDSEEFLKTTESGFEFTECLKCGSHRLNRVPTMCFDDLVEGVYCMDCGNEFSQRGNDIYIVKWEYIN